MTFLVNILSVVQKEQSRDIFELRPVSGYVSESKGINYRMSEISMGPELLNILMAWMEGQQQSSLRASRCPMVT